MYNLKNVYSNLSVISCEISLRSRISMANNFKKTEVKLKLLTDIDKLLIAEKWIGRICHAI